MKTKLSRLFLAALSAVMLCGMSPAMRVSAEAQIRVVTQGEDGKYYYTNEEVEEKTDEFSVEAQQMQKMHSVMAGQEVNVDKEDVSFSTFAELKELAAGTYTTYTYASYTGTEALVIEEDIILPEHLDLSVYGVEMKIPAGVTMSTTSSNNDLYVANLNVEGTLVLNGAYLTVNESLMITGQITNGGYIYLNADVAVVGVDKIVYNNTWSSLTWQYTVLSTAELKEAVAAANAGAENANWKYNFSVYEYESEDTVYINESVTVPANAVLNIQEPFAVAQGCTLTLEGNAYIYNLVTVEGILKANGNMLDISYEVVWNDATGILSISEGGTYTGKARIDITCNVGTDYTLAVPGLNLNNFEAIEYTYDYTHYWVLRSIEGLTRLGTPTDLEWGNRHYDVWNNETGEWDTWLQEAYPGYISWKPVSPDQGHATIHVYKDGATTPYTSHYWNFGSTDTPEWRSIDSFLNDDPESGTYHFTVTSTGDYTGYYDSETVTSGMWTYTKPDVQVGKCNNVSWNWPYITWDAPVDDTYLGGYEVMVLYAATEAEEPVWISRSWWRSTSTGDSAEADRGAGYYYIQVRALSSDITKACNGEWSPLSEAYCVLDLVEEVDNELDDILDNAETAEEIKDAVQDMDKEDLKTAMEADQSDSGTVEKLKELEEKVGGAAAVDVTEEAEAFKDGGISVVGANLNNAASEEEPITLVIDKPEKEDVIPEAYDNSVAVRFNMTLDNVEDPENLAVPVKITMPVPSTINPNFLVILHYHAATDEVEEIWPHVYKKGTQYYASFVLTSFSDFAMTQEAQNPFFDVPEDKWYYPFALRAYNEGIMSGVGTDKETGLIKFAPEANVTREQFVQILYNREGKPAVEYDDVFPDVPEQSDSVWYSDAIMWAFQNGIASGYSNGLFGVGDEITREQVAVMLKKYAEYNEYTTAISTDSDDLRERFNDVDEIHDWAMESLCWAVEYGVMSGKGTGLDPLGNASRAEAATMILNMMDSYEE